MNAKIEITVKHDTGSKKIITFAPSIEQAKNNVIAAENCPVSAIIKAQTVKLTISQIKYLTEETAPYFFNGKTMKFFKQTMKDFKVYRHGNKFLISAPRPFGKTERLFNPFTNELELIAK